VEYAGATVRAMMVEGRLTLCNLAIEMGARSGFVAPDDTTFSWISGRPFAPQGALWDRALVAWRELASDPDATFDQDIAIECGELAPQITWGTDPSQVIPVTGRVRRTSASGYRRPTAGACSKASTTSA
jgi:3-isopropylmalate/(R)-2-methylmalate dehydratase large subunit